MQDYVQLVLGVACAAAGGELFVRGAVGLARAARISPLIIATTVSAFATSSPELAVAIGSALDGTPQVALGNALGANVVNIALILGIALLISPIRSPRGSVLRDFPVALAVPAVTAVVCFDGVLSRVDGLLLLALFLVWLSALVRDALHQRRGPGSAEPSAGWMAAASGAAGLVLLFAAGALIVGGAHGIARSLGISEFVIGATLVALGTTVPELATAVVAKLRGHDEVGLGTLVGSNIFNGLWILPVAAVIHPIAIDWREVAVVLGTGVLAMLAAFPPAHGLLGRSRGAVLLALYGAYAVALPLT